MIFLYILVGILALLLLLGLIAPSSYEVSRTVVVNRSLGDVFTYLKHLKNQDEWSPWQKRDPNMHKEFEGTDGEVGFVSKWNSEVKGVGQGEQEITGIHENERIETHLRFLKPFKSESNAFMKVDEAANDSTQVTWGFSGNNKFPMSIMMLFMNMDKMIGKDFEEGLSSLKQRLETQ